MATPHAVGTQDQEKAHVVGQEAGLRPDTLSTAARTPPRLSAASSRRDFKGPSSIAQSPILSAPSYPASHLQHLCGHGLRDRHEDSGLSRCPPGTQPGHAAPRTALLAYLRLDGIQALVQRALTFYSLSLQALATEIYYDVKR